MITIDVEKVKIQKAKSGLSSSEIAERYGSSVSQLNNVLRKSNVRETTAGRIARALGCSVESILGGR